MLALVFLLFVALSSVTSQYVNDYDRPFAYQCPSGQSISYIRSRHSNSREDRQFGFSCRQVPGVGACRWHGHVNNFDQPFVFQCPNNGIISGVESYHDNGREDRRFKFTCCDMPGKLLTNCAFSAFTNNFDAPIDFNVGNGRVLKGVFSYHSNGAEDRRFRFETCTVL